jgi:predicted phosphate transport protein (TIGR00153 family)
MGSLFDMFGPSPIKPLETHMRKVYHAAKQLIPFFEAVLKDDWSSAESIKLKIIQQEKEADGIKRDLRLHLPNGLFLPVSRTSILELLSAQDRIANKAEHISTLICLRRMHIPDPIQATFMPFLQCSIDATKQACQAINELDQLLETSFRGNEVQIVEEMILTLFQIEQKSDTLLNDIQHEIFIHESSLPPIEAMFLYKIVQWIGDLADNAQTVGERLQILIAR